MFKFAFLIFVIVPITEMVLLLEVGGRIGVLPTVALVLLTAMIGASMVKKEGLKTLVAVQERLSREELPGRELVEGAMILVAGALLVTPGFFTDGVGFLLVFPLTRKGMLLWVMRLLADRVHMEAGGAHFQMGGDFPGREAPRPPGPDAEPAPGKPSGPDVVMEGEIIRDVEDSNPDRRPE